VHSDASLLLGNQWKVIYVTMPGETAIFCVPRYLLSLLGSLLFIVMEDRKLNCTPENGLKSSVGSLSSTEIKAV